MARHRVLLGLVPAVLIACGSAGWWYHADAQADERSHADAKRRYIAAVDAVCADAGQKHEEPTSEGAAAEVAELRRAARLMTDAMGRIEAVQPPSADAGRLRREFVAPGRQMAGRLTGLADRAETALRAGDETAAAKAVEESLASYRPEETMREFAERYGFQACAGG
ncbi:hypothetical protein [Actinomadura hibisca]|uniref:hypothetical protein n=1 Tax=Actinomadura hibisca TaxID=68565 RepID=UPI0008343BDC|nr:hypothetical protein [Actinomadura hibisca]